MKFLLVQLFDPCSTTFEYKPFLINLAFISKVVFYDEEIHSAIEMDVNGNKTFKTPKGALDTIYIYYCNYYHHLDVKSSKKVLAAIMPKKGKKRDLLDLP